MNILYAVLVFAVSFVIGTFGWCQIIGGLQNFRSRGPVMLIAIVVWSAILLGAYFAVRRFLSSQLTPFYFGLGISFLLSLRAGKIQ